MLPDPAPSTPVVTTQTVDRQIQQLHQMRREAALWRYGSLAVIALTVAYSIATLRSSALALVQPGPGQTEFTTKLTEGLQKDVFPNIQQIATQTLTEMRPEVTASFQKLNARTPEVAKASVDQLNLLQQNLPTRCEKVLDDTFSAELKKREGKIKTLFPDVTEDKVQALVTNMTQAGEKRMPQVADQLIGKHITAVNSIVGHIHTIHDQEKIPAGSEAANWEMALAVVDLVRDDLHDMAPPEAKAASAKTDAAQPTTATTATTTPETKK